MKTLKCFNCIHHYIDDLLGVDFDACEKHRIITPYNESLQDCEYFKSKTGRFKPSDELIEKLMNESSKILPDCELWDTQEKMRAVIKDRLSVYDKESDFIKGLKHEMGADDDNA